jgi:hypothetical protein
MSDLEISSGSGPTVMGVNALFDQVRTFLGRFNAIEFLSQFSMTFLFTPEGEFLRESDEIHARCRALEFASGLYAVAAPRQGGERVEESILQEYQHLYDSYLDALNSDLLSKAITGEQGHSSSSTTSARIHSLHVRGDAYPYQFWYLIEAIYSPHDAWFSSNLGFTISNAISIAKSVEAELNRRFATAITEAREKAPVLVREHESEWKAAGMTEAEALASASVQLSFWQSASLYRFTVADVTSMTSFLPEVCEAFFRRLSQTPPYRNPMFPTTFTDPFHAPWDYNTIKERPFFNDGGAYWVFAPHALKEVLYSTFFFDLMNDRAYKASFENSRGKVLEDLSASFLKRVFPADAVFLNPGYPNGEEFADVCVIHDRKILIVQCKSKALTLSAHTGDNEAALKRDLEQAIGNAATQGCKGRRFLETQDAPYLISDGVRVDIDKSQISEISLIAITYMPLHMFATRLREMEDDLGIPHSEFPVWALPIGDLDLVTEICNSPAKLLHYMRRRLLLEVGEKQIRGDEMDLLAFYLHQGLWLQGGDMDEASLVGLAGYSTSVDEYVFNRHEQGGESPLPKVERPEGFDALIADIESLDHQGRTDCALSFLDLSRKGYEMRFRSTVRPRNKTFRGAIGRMG